MQTISQSSRFSGMVAAFAAKARSSLPTIVSDSSRQSQCSPPRGVYPGSPTVSMLYVSNSVLVLYIVDPASPNDKLITHQRTRGPCCKHKNGDLSAAIFA